MMEGEGYIATQARVLVQSWEDRGVTIDDFAVMVSDIETAMRRVVQNIPKEEMK